MTHIALGKHTLTTDCVTSRHCKKFSSKSLGHFTTYKHNLNYYSCRNSKVKVVRTDFSGHNGYIINFNINKCSHNNYRERSVRNIIE